MNPISTTILRALGISILTTTSSASVSVSATSAAATKRLAPRSAASAVAGCTAVVSLAPTMCARAITPAASRSRRVFDLI